jgi:hypothetical protein
MTRFVFRDRDFANPQRGPEASQRIVGDFHQRGRQPFQRPWAWTSASTVASASNLFGAVTNGCPLRTPARPPRARHIPDGYSARYPPPSRPAPARPDAAGWLKMLQVMFQHRHPAGDLLAEVSGVASCRWVRPILTISLKATAFSLRLLQRVSCGISFPAGQSAPPRASRSGRRR